MLLNEYIFWFPILQVTLAAYECGTTDFPSPPYPDSIICPDSDSARASATMTIWKIMSKVRIESFCWGVGTALGELPPYFMARAHRLSGYDPDDDEEDEFLELQQKNPDSLVSMFNMDSKPNRFILGNCRFNITNNNYLTFILEYVWSRKAWNWTTCRKSWILRNIGVCICK